MLLFHFLEQESEWITRLKDEPECWQNWYEHYQMLSPKEQAVAQYMLTAAGKDGEAEEYLGMECGPIHCIDQKNVNNGYGIMYAIDRDCFLSKDTKLFYVRDDMGISPDMELGQIPRWITAMAEDIKQYSSGLAEVQTEVISYAFGGESGSYYAVTLRLDEKQIRKSIQIDDMRWWPKKTHPYLLTIMDITGEYDYAIGELVDDETVTLYRDSIFFK